MKTIKASLKMYKNGRLFCSLHKTYRVSSPPTNGCKICWSIYYSFVKQFLIDDLFKKEVEKSN